MKLYLDDNLADPALISRLTKAGHDVVRPVDAGLTGASDARHLEHAIFDGRTQMSCDSEDFKDLHRLIVTARGKHHGILLIHFDNDPARDMKPKQVVNALAKLARSGMDLTNQVVVLNHWR